MSLNYPVRGSVSEAFKLLSDPDFIVARSTAIGELEATCEVEQQGEKTVLLITRSIALHNVPKMLSKVLNPVQTVNFIERWWAEGNDMVGEYTADIVDFPIEIRATMRLQSTPEGCDYLIDHAASAGIPLISAALERFIVSQTGDGVNDEIAYLNEEITRS